MSKESGPDDPKGIQSVAMAFRILDVVGSVDHPIGVSEIARQAGEQKARIQRHLITLRAMGVLAQDESGKYRLGWRLVELGQQAIGQFDLVELAERDVKELRDRTSLTSALALVAGRGLRIAYVAESIAMMAVTVRTGLAVPRHGSAAGRLLAAYAPTGDASPDEQLRVKRIRSRGYEVSAGEISSGLHSIAAPILGPDGRMVAALVCAGTHTQITDPPARTLVDAVTHFAQRIQQRLQQSS